MDFSKVSKALAGSLITSIAATGSVMTVIPEDTGMPWYGYVIIAVCNAFLGFVGVYYAPKNTQ